MAIGVPELVVETPQAYVDVAVALANDPARLADLKQRLIAARQTSPLFDPVRFTRNLEAAFHAIHARAAAGLPPEHLERVEA